jgi:predicted ATPase
MRIAFTGSHRTGKTTLLEAVADELPAYATVDEPYRVLEDDGHELSDPPTADDYEQQLRCSFELLADDARDVLFDRCPIDFLAYAQAIGEPLDVDNDELRDAMTSLDLLVLVSIEDPDRITLPRFEDRRLREDVDTALRRLLLDENRAYGVRVLEVHGSIASRVAQVLGAVE